MNAIVLRGDARRLPLPDASVDLIVTSPPYFGLRSYTDGGEHYGGQIGSEATPQEWVAALVECTREWMRVLKPSGSMFVNLGDKYNSAASGQKGTMANGYRWQADTQGRRYPAVPGSAPKSLLGLPWRYALACTDQLGLILRRDIIWAKPNGLPESVTDRCRSSHEYLFHLVKQPRYYAAVDEIREAYEPHSAERTRRYGGNPRSRDSLAGLRATGAAQHGTNGVSSMGLGGTQVNPLGKLLGSVWNIPSQPLTVPAHLGVDHFAAFPMELPRRCVLGWSPPGVCTSCGEGRRPLSTQDFVKINEWTRGKNARGGPAHLNASRDLEAGRRAVSGRYDVTITGYACACTPHTDHPGTGESSGEGHSRPGEGVNAGGYPKVETGQVGTNGKGHTSLSNRPHVGPWREYHFDGWTPPPTRPAVVLDPFGGTGTTALVASMLGRIGVSVDRSADYTRLARWRTTDPGERARAMQVPKPPKQLEGQEPLWPATVFGGQDSLWP